MLQHIEVGRLAKPTKMAAKTKVGLNNLSLLKQFTIQSKYKFCW